MKKSSPKLLLLLLITVMASCKKEMKPELPNDQKQVTRTGTGGNVWTQLTVPVTDLPGVPPIVEGSFSFSVNNKLYIAIAGYNQLWQYDFTASQWTLLKSPFFNYALTIGDPGNVFTNGTSVYFINTKAKTLRQYDLSAAQWHNKANFPGTALSGVSATSTTSKAYIMGGMNGSDQNGVAYTISENWEYDVVADTWALKTSTPGLARYNAAAYAVGDSVYFGTGISVHFLLNIVTGAVYRNTIIDADWWEYNPTANSWTQKTSFAGGTRQDTRGFVIGGNVYLGMGSAGYFTDLRSDLWAYNPANDTWAQRASYPPGAGYPPYLSMTGAAGLGCAIDEDISSFWIYSPLYTIFSPFVSSGTGNALTTPQP